MFSAVFTCLLRTCTSKNFRAPFGWDMEIPYVSNAAYFQKGYAVDFVMISRDKYYLDELCREGPFLFVSSIRRNLSQTTCWARWTQLCLSTSWLVLRLGVYFRDSAASFPTCARLDAALLYVSRPLNYRLTLNLLGTKSGKLYENGLENEDVKKIKD